MEMPNNQIIKADAGKPELTKIPHQILYDIADVRTYGNNKYPEGGPDNWKQVEPERYRDALFRHLLLYLKDPYGVDEESGLPHIAHIACNVAFLCELEKEKRNNRNKTDMRSSKINDPISRQAALEALYSKCEQSKPCMKHGKKCDEAKAIESLPQADRPAEWIPVSERLPYAEYGEGDSVLCCTEIGLMEVLYWNGGNWCFPTGEPYIWVNHKTGWHDEVIAWMPLPKPYREEGENHE